MFLISLQFRGKLYSPMLFPVSQLFGHNFVFSLEAFDTVILVKGEQPLKLLIFTKKK